MYDAMLSRMIYRHSRCRMYDAVVVAYDPPPQPLPMPMLDEEGEAV